MNEREWFLFNKWCNVLARIAKIGNWRIKRGQPPEAIHLDPTLKLPGRHE